MKLGNTYRLSDGRTAVFDFNDSLHLGITCSDGEKAGFNYLYGVERWLERRNAVLISEGSGGFTDSKECRYCQAMGVS